MWQDSSYGSPSAQNAYYAQPPPQQQAQQPNMQFYSPADANGFYSRPSLEGSMSGAAQGSMSATPTAAFGGNIQVQGPWWTAFGTGGLEGEPPLLEGTRIEYPTR